MQVVDIPSHPFRAIVHLLPDELIAETTGRRLPLYQIEVIPHLGLLSPSGKYIRLPFSTKEGEPVCELHGWFELDHLVIDEIIEELIDDEWCKPEVVGGIPVEGQVIGG